jgi:hypothetical protein
MGLGGERSGLGGQLHVAARGYLDLISSLQCRLCVPQRLVAELGDAFARHKASHQECASLYAMLQGMHQVGGGSAGRSSARFAAAAKGGRRGLVLASLVQQGEVLWPGAAILLYCPRTVIIGSLHWRQPSRTASLLALRCMQARVRAYKRMREAVANMVSRRFHDYMKKRQHLAHIKVRGWSGRAFLSWVLGRFPEWLHPGWHRKRAP